MNVLMSPQRNMLERDNHHCFLACIREHDDKLHWLLVQSQQMKAEEQRAYHYLLCLSSSMQRCTPRWDWDHRITLQLRSKDGFVQHSDQKVEHLFPNQGPETNKNQNMLGNIYFSPVVRYFISGCKAG